MAVQSGQKRELWTHLRSPRVFFVFGNSYRIEKLNCWTITFQEQHSGNHPSEATFKNSHHFLRPTLPKKDMVLCKNSTTQKKTWKLKHLQRISNQKKNHFVNPNSSDTTAEWKKKMPFPTGPRHLELLNLSQFLLQGPHPPT